MWKGNRNVLGFKIGRRPGLGGVGGKGRKNARIFESSQALAVRV